MSDDLSHLHSHDEPCGLESIGCATSKSIYVESVFHHEDFCDYLVKKYAGINQCNCKFKDINMHIEQGVSLRDLAKLYKGEE